MAVILLRLFALNYDIRGFSTRRAMIWPLGLEFLFQKRAGERALLCCEIELWRFGVESRKTMPQTVNCNIMAVEKRTGT